MLSVGQSLHDRIDYGCDWCRCGIKEWEMVFQCADAEYTDRHDYCKRCVGTVVILNQELNQLLLSLLRGDLIDDCVTLITEFVIGRVSYTEFAALDDAEDTADEV